MDKIPQLLQDHQLFLESFKCTFGVSKVEYLGHIISKEGECGDPKKNIAIMKDWAYPKIRKRISEFLGLTRYYRNLLGTRKIAVPLINFLISLQLE